MNNKINKKYRTSPGISMIIVILIVSVLLLAAIGYFSFKLIQSKKSQAGENQNTTTETTSPKPVYETQIGDIKFKVVSAINLGNTIKATQGWQQDVTTTEKFIQVSVGAQNKGKIATKQGSWGFGNIIDSEERQFVDVSDGVYYFLPQPNLCGAPLQPEFDQTLCVRIYEVSKKSKGLKIEVINTITGQADVLDLNVQ